MTASKFSISSLALLLVLGVASEGKASSTDANLVVSGQVYGGPGEKVGDIIITGSAPFNGQINIIGGERRFILRGTSMYVGGAQIPPGQYSVKVQIKDK